MVTKIMCALMLLLPAHLASAEHLGFDGATPLETAQLELLRNSLRDFAGVSATVRFTSEFLSPIASYNRINDATAALLNLVRSKDEKVLGAGAREVIVDLGPVAYRCQGLVQFRGGLEAKDLVYAGLNACTGFFTKAAANLDTQCLIAKKQSPNAPCPGINFVLPSALSFEIRR